MNQATLLFANDERISKSEQVKEFVKNNSAPFSTLLLDDELVVVVQKINDDKQSYEEVRMLAGSIAKDLSGRNVEQALLNEKALIESFSQLEDSKVIIAFVEGWNLGTYKFITYKSKATVFATELVLNESNTFKTETERGQLRANAMAFSRDLMNELSNVLNPETFPEVLKENFAQTDVKINVLDKAKIEELKMNGLLTVGRGSEYDPSFVEIKYEGDPSKPLVALVGKGVTFDTGGISLKGSRDLSDMRMDMGGAAAVSGAMKLLAESNAKVNVIALLPIVENMPDSKAVLPGEVIQYKNGHTVQIGNTDAEGRLILADGLIRAGEHNAEYVVNIATLTGAIVSALGSKIAGVFGDDTLAADIKAIGDENGDFNWQMPLVDAYDSYLNSDYADFSNISSKGEAGAITAGLFLRRFVPENCKWLHVDMAGVMESTNVGYYAKSATGFGARLLADFTEHVSK